MTKRKSTICYLSAAAGDWGGASRVLFSNLEILNRERYEPIVLLPSEGPILERLQRLGIRYEIWGKRHEPNGILRYLADVFRAVMLFRKNHVDLFHINDESYWRPAEIVAARLLRIPIVTHYHVVTSNPGPYIKYSATIAAVSEFTAKNSGPPGVPKAVIHNSVHLERFDQAKDIRTELNLAPEDVVVSFVGQIREIKGIDLFIKMARAIPHEHAKFLIVGECRDPRRFEGSYTVERLQAEIGGDSRIRYVGYRSDVQNIYRSSDIIVMPSRWGEPFGLINIEAGAARKPMIATRDGGITEIIRHGENGFLINKEDLAALIGYTKQLIENEPLRKQMGERARQIVEQEFTDQPVRKLEALYDALIRR